MHDDDLPEADPDDLLKELLADDPEAKDFTLHVEARQNVEAELRKMVRRMKLEPKSPMWFYQR
jgi:hypothetical protein